MKLKNFKILDTRKLSYLSFILMSLSLYSNINNTSASISETEIIVDDTSNHENSFDLDSLSNDSNQEENIIPRAMSYHTEYLMDKHEKERLKEERKRKKELKRQLEEDKKLNPIYVELRDYIYEMSVKYGVPFGVLTTIGHQESHGTWRTNSAISDTGDYGLFQINLGWNFEDIHNKLGFSEQDILHNPYKNIEASAYLLQKIMNVLGYTRDYFSYEEIFGYYNDWCNWRDNEMACEYVSTCMDILSQNLYPYRVKEDKEKVKKKSLDK